MTLRYPTYQELSDQEVPGRPAGTSWGVFTEPWRGSPSFVEPADVIAAATTVRTGETLGLDYALDAFDPGMSVKREKPVHVIFSGHACHRDDYLDRFYLQASTQIDALRHRRADDTGFYNGVSDEAIVAGRPELGVQVWADAPIVGRAVLVDVAAHLDSDGRPIDHAAGQPIEFADFIDAASSQGVEFRRGDIVLVHTGWAEWFLGLSEDARREHARTRLATGLRQDRDYPRWAWDTQVALLATDTFAVERLPVVPDSPFQESAPDDHGMMHQEFLAKLGIPLGELWRLGPLARALRSVGRHDCLVVVKPLNLVGGTGSPANATAVL